MGSVQVRRLLHDYPASWELADKKAGRRLDRRKNYMIIENQICQIVRFTDSCSGCCESGDYGGNLRFYKFDEKARCHVGAGCDECGYTGKVRHEHWVPIPKGDL